MKLPVLLSIPHCSLKVPDEILGRIDISETDIFEESDAYTEEIYGLPDLAEDIIMPYAARVFVDVNRDPEQNMPGYFDGAVKSMTSYKKDIYKPGMLPGEDDIKKLISRYHRPYHEKIESALSNPDLKFAVDCHSMSPVAPPISINHGKARPVFCIGNADGSGASMEITDMMAASLKSVFSLSYNDILINDPFTGGYMTQNYGNRPVPWILIEINKDMYLGKKWFDPENNLIDKERLVYLNSMFRDVIISFFERAAGIL